jgi:hypothetical protein
MNDNQSSEEGEVLGSSPMKRSMDQAEDLSAYTFHGVSDISNYELADKLGDGTFGNNLGLLTYLRVPLFMLLFFIVESSWRPCI